MALRRKSPGRRFTRDDWVLSPAVQRRRLWFGALLFSFVVVAVAGAALVLQAHYFPDERVAALEREMAVLEARNDDLRSSLERAMLDLEIASVTRAELERQLVVMTERHRAVQEELEFLKSAGGEGES